VASLDGGEEKLLLRSPATAQYASGHLLYLRETTLMARPFDAAKLEFTGDAVPLAERILMPAAPTAVGVFSASENGVLVYQTGQGDLTTSLRWFGRDGQPVGTLGEPAEYGEVVLSPDGRQAAVTIRDPATGMHDIWVYDAVREGRTRFTFDASDDRAPVWSPDGTQLAFCSNRRGSYDLYRKSLEGAAEEELLLETPRDEYPAGFVDATRLFFTATGPGQEFEHAVLPLDGERKPVTWRKARQTEIASPLSPDGRWLPYSSEESGRWEIYVTSFPRGGRKVQVSTQGAAYAFWRADGREILFQDLSGLMWTAGVTPRGETLEVGEPRPLFRVSGPNPAGATFWPTADFSRFLVIGGEQKPATHLELVVDWPRLRQAAR
jgi:hypothetical protein